VTTSWLSAQTGKVAMALYACLFPRPADAIGLGEQVREQRDEFIAGLGALALFRAVKIESGTGP
jgi:hypothetical protein